MPAPMPASRLVTKICGLSTPDTVAAAMESGADMVGFVFFPPSPRHVTPETAVALAQPVRGRAAVVALTVDADDAALDAILATLDPDWFQLHGRESPERVAAVRRRTGRPVLKALGVSTREDAEAAVARFGGVADRLLFDAKPSKNATLPGGNGQAFDWTVLTGLECGGLDPDVPFMLSGGLTVANVAEAIRVSRAGGVDVSSGVEVAPGRKDAGLIAAFLAAARATR